MVTILTCFALGISVSIHLAINVLLIIGGIRYEDTGINQKAGTITALAGVALTVTDVVLTITFLNYLI